MTLVSRIPSSLLAAIHSRATNPFGLKSVFIVHCASNLPFTEKHSIERYQRDSWLYKNQQQQPSFFSSSCSPPSDQESTRDYDIALQLPELRKFLEVLRENENKVLKRGPGTVFLVGMRSSDPELLMLKALRVIQNDDVFLYDRLVSDNVLNLVGLDARLLHIGKTGKYYSRTQICLFV